MIVMRRNTNIGNQSFTFNVIASINYDNIFSVN